MKTTLLISSVLAASMTLTGCVIAVDGDGWDGDSYDNGSSSHWENQEKQNREKLATLNPGMSVQQVETLMGTAAFNEFYQQNDKQIQVLFYRTQRTKGDGKTTKDECTPLVFEQGELKGWGERAYQSI